MFKSKTWKDNGIDIPSWDTPVYRVFSSKRFLDLIATGKMGLLRPAMWDDPFENFFLKCRIVSKDGTETSLEEIYRSWFGQCWTLEPDSDAMWRIYSPNKDGVRVSTTIEKLFRAVYDELDDFRTLNYFVGQVTYMSRTAIEEFIERTSFWDVATGGQTIQFAQLLCIKRLEFAHEKEVRILRRLDNHSSDIIDIGLDLHSVFGDVVLDPRLSTTDFESQKSKLQAAGCRLPISQSELYKIKSDLLIRDI